MSKIETGRNFPSVETFKNIAKALDVDVKDLFDFEHKWKTAKKLKKN